MWPGFAVILSSLFTFPVQAMPLNDSYSFEDGFRDNTGIDLDSSGFINTGGVQAAKNKSNRLVSRCFQLPQAAGGKFTGWSFAEFSIDNLDQIKKNSLSIESCDGNTSFLTVSPEVGVSAYDLSAAVPPSNTHIRFNWSLVYQGNGGARSVAISSWRALGTSAGTSLISITPSANSTASNTDLSFAIGLTSTGATTRNPILQVDLSAINGSPDTGVAGIGLATDATVCYDIDNNGTAGIPLTECKRYRPLEFLSASNGSNGEPADLSNLSQAVTTPASAAPTDGIIQWELADLADSYNGSVSVNLHIPKGYINGKTIALAATLTHGEVSADGTQNNLQTVSAISPTVTVVSEHNNMLSVYSPFGNLGPGAQNIQDNYYIRNRADQAGSPSDLENTTIKIYSPVTASCVPLYRSTRVNSRYNWPVRLVEPAAGAPLDSNPLSVTYFRSSYVNDSSNARVRVHYDVPNDCSNGTITGTKARTVSASPPVTGTPGRNHNIVFNACRGGFNHMHRLQSGLLIGNSYQPYPGWNEYYINSGSVRPGEYISTWSPYGDASYRTQTIVLDKSYALIKVPATTTFHGYRSRNKEDADSKIYFFKDPDGTAANPVDAGFNNDFDPATQTPAPGWYPVQRSWRGPFNNYTGTAADHTDPAAVVGSGARLLVVKTNDNTSFGASDRGLLRAQAVWRVCDGSYGCMQSPDDTPVRVTGNSYTYQQTQAPFARSCSVMDGYTSYVRSVSYPKVYTRAVQQNVQAGGIARIILSPHNANMASQFVHGHWSFDLTEIASNIDLDNVTAETLTDGLNLPKAGQNIQGQSCSVSDIVFVAPSAANPIAYWNIPDRCQIPNGWGYQVSNNTTQDNYTPAYQLQLNVPVKPDTLANSVLKFRGQIRRKDLSTPGADNAVSVTRWRASNYESITAVSVLESPSLSASKSAPTGWPTGSSFSYSMNILNQGNTPLKGYFLIDQLPRRGVNGSEFDPGYGSVFVDAPASDMIVERSDDSRCHSNPFTAGWSIESLTATARAGYQSQTATLPQTTLCIRVRRAPSGAALQPQQSINLAVDVSIPDDVFLSGKKLHNKAAVGVTGLFGGTSDIATSETALVSTTVDGAVVLGAEKTTSASIVKPGQIGWHLRYRNISGTRALAVTVSDNLPAALTYTGLIEALPDGVRCKHGSAGDLNNDGIEDCAIINTSVDGSGGTLEFDVSLLDPADGNPVGGTDQGEVAIWTSLTSTDVVHNCVFSTPAGGVSGTGCISGQLSPLTLTKSQQVDTGRTGRVPPAYFGETIRYSLIAEHRGTTAGYLRIRDHLPPQLSYIPGSLLINGASASDRLVTNGVLSYSSTLPMAPLEITTIEFSAMLERGTAGVVFSNSATSMLCSNRSGEDSCMGARRSNEVQAEINGSRIQGIVFNDNGNGSAIAHDGRLQGAEKPLAGIQVSLINSSKNQHITRTLTNNNGKFTLYSRLAAGDDYQIRATIPARQVAVSHHKGNTRATEASRSTTSLSFQPLSSDAAYSEIRFGLIEKPLLTGDQIKSTIPSASVLFSHTLHLTSPGEVNFNISDAQSVSALDGWQVELFHDLECNGQLASTDPALTSALTVDPDINTELCVIFQLHAPGRLSADLTLYVPLTATITLQDTAATGHAVSIVTSVMDTLEITLSDNGQLVLSKQVSNMTRSQAMATSNQAKPGETLRYQIDFENAGNADITEVFIHDYTPVYTSLQESVTCPPGLTGCQVIVPASADNNSGYRGEIRWRIADMLPAGSRGLVFYDVTVE